MIDLNKPWSSTETIPPLDAILVDGTLQKPVPFAAGPVPAHSNWWLLKYHLADDLLLLTWYYGLTMPKMIHAQIFNQGTKTRIISRPLPTGSATLPFPLSPSSGLSFTAWDGVVIFMDQVPDEFDLALDKAILGDSIESKLTFITGSPVNEFWPKLGALFAKYGPSLTLLRYADAYRRGTDMRPIHRFSDHDTPSMEKDPTSQGEVEPNEAGFTEKGGQHFDMDEDVVGYEMTGDPTYLYSMWHAFEHSRVNVAGLWEIPGQSYSGSIRLPARWLIFLARFMRVLRNAPPHPAFEVLMDRVAESTRWHLENVKRLGIVFPSPWYNGTPGQWFKDNKVDYLFPWQVGILGFAGLMVAAEEGFPQNTRVASDGVADFVLDWLPEPFPGIPYLDGQGGALYVIGKDGEHPVYQSILGNPGTVLWPIAPFTMAFPNPDDAPEIAKELLASLRTLGWADPAHKHHFSAVSLAAPWVGYPEVSKGGKPPKTGGVGVDA